jgi:hypothetical protein
MSRFWSSLVLTALLAGGCVTAKKATYAPVNPPQTQVVDSRAKLDEAFSALNMEIDKTCRSRWSQESAVSSLAVDGTWYHHCVRDVLGAAFGNASGEKACSRYADTSEYMRCVIKGGYLSVVRERIPLAQPLSITEWQDTGLAADNTTAALRQQSVITCGSSGNGILTPCEVELMIQALGLAQWDAMACEPRAFNAGNCLIELSMEKFVKQRMVLVW